MATRRILAIDGGGIKGVIPAAFLATVEQGTGRRVVDHFDLIAGTSTGAIIALGLSLRLSAEEILAFYENEGPHIFGQEGAGASAWRKSLAFARGLGRSLRRTVLPKHDPTALRIALQGAFGDSLLGDCETRVVVPAFDRERRDIHVFKTAHHERFGLDWKERAVDVAMASAAAPSYLPGHRTEIGISFIDGGVWANNPVGLAVVEAIAILGWEPESIRVLSLGCSEAPFRIPEDGGLTGLALKIADIFMLGQSRGALGTAKLLLRQSGPDKRLFRYQHASGPGDFQLDGTTKIETLKGLGVGLARHALPEVSRAFFSEARDRFVPFHPPPEQQK